jgi:hypothetical protein
MQQAHSHRAQKVALACLHGALLQCRGEELPAAMKRQSFCLPYAFLLGPREAPRLMRCRFLHFLRCIVPPKCAARLPSGCCSQIRRCTPPSHTTPQRSRAQGTLSFAGTVELNHNQLSGCRLNRIRGFHLTSVPSKSNAATFLHPGTSSPMYRIDGHRNFHLLSMNASGPCPLACSRMSFPIMPEDNPFIYLSIT